jgi:hypothetical protein
LSEQITVTEPRVSTAGSLQISAWRLSRRCATKPEVDGHRGSKGFRRRCQRQAYRRQQQLRQRLAAQQTEDDDHRPPIRS